MQLIFEHQKFQAEAAQAVVDVFKGQSISSSSYLIDRGSDDSMMSVLDVGWRNKPIDADLTDEVILNQINKIQDNNNICLSDKLEGRYNLTIEMETGVGKTYTYIKTMYELNKNYGWSKFIIVVPSIAIREGVKKSFEVTEQHFLEEYGKKIRYFIYNSSKLNDIQNFASDSSIHVMIINSQAFNAKGKDARRIYMTPDDFRSRRPIDVIAKTNPILIIDEPQSVEGKQTKENLKQFNPLFTLRYSATHKKDSIYNMIYRLDAIDAFNKKLVKKIKVIGVTQQGSTATNAYIYLESINVSPEAPTATLSFEIKRKDKVSRITKTVKEKFNLYENSNQLEEYKEGYIVKSIDARDNSIEFINGIKLYVGETFGNIAEPLYRRIQIRETIKSHLKKECELYKRGIKVLSLFFIDKVEKYKQYDESGNSLNGEYADMFEEEYQNIINDELDTLDFEKEYKDYLKSISAKDTHAGYFSIDKKGKMIDSKVGRKETTSDDVDAYDLIMKNKELLLDLDPKRSPVRFIFSHSALREGWDNPNVFQICTLKQSSSEVRKRQEVGRGLRLCVDKNGKRMDEKFLGNEFHNVNKLTVIASESYSSFVKGLQTEYAESISDRPTKITEEFFIGHKFIDIDGNEQKFNEKTAKYIRDGLYQNDYIDKEGNITEKFEEDVKNNNVQFIKNLADFVKSKDSIVKLITSNYGRKLIPIENEKDENVELKVRDEMLKKKEFQELWKLINSKSYYVVDFDNQELVERSIWALNESLNVSSIRFIKEEGEMKDIKSKEELLNGNAFKKDNRPYDYEDIKGSIGTKIKYDLVGKLVEATNLTRKTIIQILTQINIVTFNLFKLNPEEFIIKAGKIINTQKAALIIDKITYKISSEKYDTNIFREPTIRGVLGKNALEVNKHLYNFVVCDSQNEMDFVSVLDRDSNVAVYVKLPSEFFIPTPVGNYNPDWAIAFYEGTVKYIYFVAETKGSIDQEELRGIEEKKIECAKKHFKAISNGTVVYGVVDGKNYETLLDLVKPVCKIEN